MNYFILFSFAFLLTTILVPFFISLGKRYKIVDEPTSRKVHSSPIVRTGGFAVLLGSMIPFILYMPKNRLLLGICLGAICILFVGGLDDIWELSYKWKFAGQFLVAFFTLFAANIRADIIIQLWSGLTINFRFLSIPLYFIFLVASINIINLADGLDGLASGICLLIFFCTAFFAYFSRNYSTVVLCFCMMGGIIGFMRYNTHPAIVFLGDTGSLFLGFSVGVCMILLSSGNRITSPIIPFYIIGVPIIDTSLVILERFMDKRSIFKADKNHLHHKLLKIGFKHNEAVIIIYSIQVFMIILAWSLRFFMDGILLGIYMALLTIGLIFLLLFRKRAVSVFTKYSDQQQENSKFLSRNTVCRIALYCLLGGIFLFCIIALFAVRSYITIDIGLISLGLIITILFLIKFSPKHAKGALKLSAYFICLFLISALDYQINSFFSIYNLLFIGMGISYVVYIISSMEKVPFFAMDCLLLGLIIFVLFLSETQPWLVNIKNAIIHTLFIFLFIELLFYKYKEKKLLLPIFLTLTSTCAFAFCF